MTRRIWVTAALFAATVAAAHAQQPAKPALPPKPALQAKPAQGAKPAQPATAKRGPYGWLDEPAEGSTVGKKTEIYGWALSERGKVSKIEILLDGKAIKANLKRIPRGGLCPKFPTAVDCPNPGFLGEADFSRAEKGSHTLAARFTDSTGATVELGKKNVTVK